MTLVLFSKEPFFAIFMKPAPRAAFARIASLSFWKRRSHSARSLAKNDASQDGYGIIRLDPL
ncbi:MAG: hypothetical protein H7834_11695 [Magnetococcus sp. YQC-9]